MSDDIKKDINEVADAVKGVAGEVIEEVKAAFSGQPVNPNVGNAGYRAPQGSSPGAKAGASLVLGIVSCGVGIWMWYISIPCAIIGIVLGALARKENQTGIATAGFVISIIGLALAIVMFVCVVCFAAGLSSYY